jgi:hypothetical protein
MINSYPQLALDIVVKAAVGVAIAAVNQTNQALWATILVTQAVANFVLSKIAQAKFSRLFTAETIKESARAISYLVATILLYQTGLISLRVAGLFGFFDLAFLLGRIKWLKAQVV